jgi:hypothetical protein
MMAKRRRKIEAVTDEQAAHAIELRTRVNAAGKAAKHVASKVDTVVELGAVERLAKDMWRALGAR